MKFIAIIGLLTTFLLSCSQSTSSGTKAKGDLDFTFGNENPIDPVLMDWFHLNQFFAFSEGRSPMSNQGLKWTSAMRALYGESLATFSNEELAVLHAISSADGDGRIVVKALRGDLGRWQEAANRFNHYRSQAEIKLKNLLFDSGDLAMKLRDLSAFHGVTSAAGHNILPARVVENLQRYGSVDDVYRTPMPIVIKRSPDTNRAPIFVNQVTMKIPASIDDMSILLQKGGLINLAPFSANPEEPQALLFAGWDYRIRPHSLSSESVKIRSRRMYLHSIDADMLSFVGDQVLTPCRKRPRHH